MVVVLVSDQTKLDSAIRIFRKKGQKEGIIKEARRRSSDVVSIIRDFKIDEDKRNIGLNKKYLVKITRETKATKKIETTTRAIFEYFLLINFKNNSRISKL